MLIAIHITNIQTCHCEEGARYCADVAIYNGFAVRREQTLIDKLLFSSDGGTKNAIFTYFNLSSKKIFLYVKKISAKLYTNQGFCDKI